MKLISSDQVNKYLIKRKFSERILLTLAVLAFIYYIWDNLIYANLNAATSTLEDQIKSVKNKIVNLNTQLIGVESLAKLDPSAGLKDKIANLTIENQQYEQQIKDFTSKLVPPGQMTNLLKTMLSKDEGLIVEKIENVPEKPLFQRTKEDIENDVDQVQVYQHGLIVSFKGKYFNTVKFLSELEKSEYQFIWNRIDYSVDSYPDASISLLIYTLSLDTTWISI